MSKMLATMTSEEVSEWQAYFKIRKERDEKDKPKGGAKPNKQNATLG